MIITMPEHEQYSVCIRVMCTLALNWMNLQQNESKIFIVAQLMPECNWNLSEMDGKKNENKQNNKHTTMCTTVISTCAQIALRQQSWAHRLRVECVRGEGKVSASRCIWKLKVKSDNRPIKWPCDRKYQQQSLSKKRKKCSKLKRETKGEEKKMKQNKTTANESQQRTHIFCETNMRHESVSDMLFRRRCRSLFPSALTFSIRFSATLNFRFLFVFFDSEVLRSLCGDTQNREV